MRLCRLRMRLCKGYTDKEKRKMKTCDSHVNEEVKFVTKCCWPEKERPDDDCDSLEPNTTHIYLEKEDGIPVSKALITQQGQRMRSLWATLHKQGLAPTVWSNADSFAVKFLDSAMLNDPRFHYLGLCDNN